MKMKGLDPVVIEDGKEETGERGDEPSKDAVQEEGIDGLTQRFQLDGAEPDHRLPSFIVAGCHQREHGGEVLLLGYGRDTEGRLRVGSRTRGRSGRLCFLGGH